MLDALMGADRNAPVEGASGIASYGDSGPISGPTRRKKSCYDKDICPLYCAWSISSQDEPTWAEGMAVNEGMGGIDVFVSVGSLWPRCLESASSFTAFYFVYSNMHDNAPRHVRIYSKIPSPISAPTPSESMTTRATSSRSCPTTRGADLGTRTCSLGSCGT